MKTIAGTGVLVLILLLSAAGLSDDEGVIVKGTFDPYSAKSYYNRGVKHQRQGEYDKAISCYTTAIEKEPGLVEAYNNRGLAYREGEAYYDGARAIRDFDMAIEIDPNFASAYYNRGITYLREGRYDKAWDDVYKAHSLGLEVDPELFKSLRKAPERQEEDNKKNTEKMPENKDWFQ